MEWHIRDAQLITAVLLFSLGSSVHLSTVRRGKDKAVGLKSRKKISFCDWKLRLTWNKYTRGEFVSFWARQKKKTNANAFSEFSWCKKINYTLILSDRHIWSSLSNQLLFSYWSRVNLCFHCKSNKSNYFNFFFVCFYAHRPAFKASVRWWIKDFAS